MTWYSLLISEKRCFSQTHYGILSKTKIQNQRLPINVLVQLGFITIISK